MHVCNTVRSALILSILGMLLTTSCFAGGLPDDLNEYIHSGMAAWKIPGLSIAIVSDNQVQYEAGYGVLEAGKPGKVDVDTLFAIGSASKAFTAAALGTLVDKGKLKWDDRVVDHWPEFRMSDPWVTQEIRVSDLLANHSGLSEVAEEIWYGTGYDRKELIQRLAKVPITEGFRYQFQYRNLMFLAAGQLIPHLTAGTTWDEYVKEHLFKPLKMDRSTTTLKNIKNETNLAQPHLIDYQLNPLPIPYRNIDHIAPAGSIMSTARNMGNWVRMLVMGGTFDNKTILKPETLAFIERSQTPVSTVGPGGKPLSPPAQLRAYALSWVTESYKGRRIVWHNGSIDGMSAWVGFVPDLKLGMVILSNLDEANFRTALFYRIIDSFNGNAVADLNQDLLVKHHDELDQRDKAEKQWLALKDNPVKSVLGTAEYAGKYSNPAFGDVEIVLENNQLTYHRTPSMILDLRFQEGNTFLGKYRNIALDLREGKVKLDFHIENGKITGFAEGELIFHSANKHFPDDRNQSSL